MRRIYEAAAARHFQQNRQMLFLSGPRQVGKTTSGQVIGTGFPRADVLSWDNPAHRRLIMAGPDRVAESLDLHALSQGFGHVLFDEIHKYRKWKDFLKGFFDTWGQDVRITVTGSARLDTFNRGGDSLMGRYFPYRMHPLSAAELTTVDLSDQPIRREPLPVSDQQLSHLLRFGGFPEPLLKADVRFYNRWRRLRSELLFREDLRDLTRITEVSQVELLATLVSERSGQLTSFSSLANEINASVDSIRRWLKTLEALHFVFPVRPWFKNVARSLRKEPKYYLWDWSLVGNEGQRIENLVASALLKAVHFWTDEGWGDFSLHYLRDKEKREVDFLVVKDAAPWFLVEVKKGSDHLSPALGFFLDRLGADHAFQAVLEREFVRADCFSTNRPTIVPLRTLLAQLV